MSFIQPIALHLRVCSLPTLYNLCSCLLLVFPVSISPSSLSPAPPPPTPSVVQRVQKCAAAVERAFIWAIGWSVAALSEWARQTRSALPLFHSWCVIATPYFLRQTDLSTSKWMIRTFLTNEQDNSSYRRLYLTRASAESHSLEISLCCCSWMSVFFSTSAHSEVENGVTAWSEGWELNKFCIIMRLRQWRPFISCSCHDHSTLVRRCGFIHVTRKSWHVHIGQLSVVNCECLVCRVTQLLSICEMQEPVKLPTQTFFSVLPVLQQWGRGVLTHLFFFVVIVQYCRNLFVWRCPFFLCWHRGWNPEWLACLDHVMVHWLCTVL